MSVLMIGEREKTAIKSAMDRARRKPLRFDYASAGVIDQSNDVVTLADRERAGFERREYKSQQVLLPVGYRLAISYEMQPAGLCAHLSISVDNKPGKLPNPAAIMEIIDACGFGRPPYQLAGRNWVEEFLIDGKPGGFAFNILFVVEKTIAGHA